MSLSPGEIARLKTVAAREERRQRYMKRLPLMVGLILAGMLSGNLATRFFETSPVLGLITAGLGCILIPAVIGYMIVEGIRINR